MLDFKEYFYYDETSPSCLRWKRDVGTKIKAGQVSGTLKSDNHWRVTVNKKHYYCHRVVWELHNESVPETMVIDHISGDGSDNRLSNLRVVTQEVNNRNAKKRVDNSTGVKGISVLKNKDRRGEYYYYVTAYYQYDGKRVNKRFPIALLGLEKAMELAVCWRNEQIKVLNDNGFGYTDRHTSND